MARRFNIAPANAIHLKVTQAPDGSWVIFEEYDNEIKEAFKNGRQAGIEEAREIAEAAFWSSKEHNKEGHFDHAPLFEAMGVGEESAFGKMLMWINRLRDGDKG